MLTSNKSIFFNFSVVIDVIMDMHSCLNRMIQSINPAITSHNSIVLCQIFKQGIRESAIGNFI